MAVQPLDVSSADDEFCYSLLEAAVELIRTGEVHVAVGMVAEFGDGLLSNHRSRHTVLQLFYNCRCMLYARIFRSLTDPQLVPFGSVDSLLTENRDIRARQLCL